MVDAAETIANFVSGRARKDLDSDRMLLFALVRAVEVLGEAAAKVSPEARAEAASVPWPQIVAMRNRLRRSSPFGILPASRSIRMRKVRPCFIRRVICWGEGGVL